MKQMMKQSEVHPMRLLAGAFFVAMLLCGTVSAQQPGMVAPMAGVLGANAATQPVPSKQATAEARPESVASEPAAPSLASILATDRRIASSRCWIERTGALTMRRMW